MWRRTPRSLHSCYWSRTSSRADGLITDICQRLGDLTGDDIERILQLPPGFDSELNLRQSLGHALKTAADYLRSP